MVALPQIKDPSRGPSHGCGTTCGAGLEKIYPTTAVRFSAMSWLGEFSYRPGTTFKCGGRVVIETDRGIELGQQVSLYCAGCNKQITREQLQDYIRNSGPEFYKLNSGRILREATEQDVSEQDHLNAHTHEDIDTCALLAAQLQLDMKVVTAEHLLGGERVVFYFTSESRIDFRQLVKELAHYFRTRIEMRQVGARDEARLVADHEICGRECCCKNFLKKLRPVNMKMAKLQKSTLDPSKVSGRCGRLRCCLRYEHEGYELLAAKLPAIESRVDTEYGPATVIDRQILTQLVLVRTDDEKEVTVPLEEIKAFNLPRPPPKPVEPVAPAPEEKPRARESGSRFRPQEPASRRPRRESGPRAPAGAPPVAKPGNAPTTPGRPPEPPAAEGTSAPGAPRESRARRRRRRRRGERGPEGGPPPPTET